MEFVRPSSTASKELRIVIPLLLAGQKLVLPRVLQRRAVGFRQVRPEAPIQRLDCRRLARPREGEL